MTDNNEPPEQISSAVSSPPQKSTMAWGLATAVGALNDALQRWNVGLVAYKLYETKPLSVSPVSGLEKKRKFFKLGIYYFA